MSDDAAPDYTGTNDPFAFIRVNVPNEPAGKYQTMATLMRVVGWLALVAGAFSIIGILIGLLVSNIFGAVTGLGYGGLVGLFVVLQVVVGLAVAVLLSIWSGRTLALWATREADALARAKTFGIYVIVAGAVNTVLGGSWLGLGLIGVGIALVVIAGDDELPAHFES